MMVVVVFEIIVLLLGLWMIVVWLWIDGDGRVGGGAHKLFWPLNWLTRDQ